MIVFCKKLVWPLKRSKAKKRKCTIMSQKLFWLLFTWTKISWNQHCCQILSFTVNSFHEIFSNDTEFFISCVCVCNTVWKNEKFSLTKIISRQINSCITKPLLSRNFCQRCEIEFPKFLCCVQFTGNNILREINLRKLWSNWFHVNLSGWLLKEMSVLILPSKCFLGDHFNALFWRFFSRNKFISCQIH